MRVVVRYDVPRDYSGKEPPILETRREFNARFGKGADTPELDELPLAGQHLWEWFWQLQSQRTSSDGGYQPIGFANIAAWAQLLRTQPSPWEVQTLVHMDGAFLVTSSQEAEAVRQLAAGRKPSGKGK